MRRAKWGAVLGAIGSSVDVEHMVHLVVRVPPSLLPALEALARVWVDERAWLEARLGVSVVQIEVGQVAVEGQATCGAQVSTYGVEGLAYLFRTAAVMQGVERPQHQGEAFGQLEGSKVGTLDPHPQACGQGL